MMFFEHSQASLQLFTNKSHRDRTTTKHDFFVPMPTFSLDIWAGAFERGIGPRKNSGDGRLSNPCQLELTSTF
ncbi:MAG: hypothetical protein RLZZ338_763 [Cyanobacteriota bacterium]|jgi:hypothetical protein